MTCSLGEMELYVQCQELVRGVGIAPDGVHLVRERGRLVQLRGVRLGPGGCHESSSTRVSTMSDTCSRSASVRSAGMAGGRAGVNRTLQILEKDMARTMALLGVSKIAELTPDHVRLLNK